MLIATSWTFAQSPDVIWPLLCNSRMQPARSWLFRLGLPQPTECRLPDGQGGVGSPRQCVAEEGAIEQTILEWEAPRRLRFRMDRSDLSFKSWVSAIEDTFELVPTANEGTRITRTTRATIAGRFGWVKRAALWLGLKKIHRFVFGNWERLAAEKMATAMDFGTLA